MNSLRNELAAALLVLGAILPARGMIPPLPTRTPFVVPTPDPVAGCSPNPTKPALLRRDGAMHANQLFGRQLQPFQSDSNPDLTNPAMCGYHNGLSASPYYCVDDRVCASTISSGGLNNFWCCLTGAGGVSTDDCAYVTGCIAYSDESNNLGTTDGIYVDVAANVLYCPSTREHCTTQYLYSSGGTSIAFTQMGCGESALPPSIYYQTIQAISATETTTAEASETSSSVASTASAESGDVSTASTTSDSDSDSDAGPNVGAIAGGIVGGVVGLALIGVIVWLVVRKRQERKPAMREVDRYD